MTRWAGLFGGVAPLALVMASAATAQDLQSRPVAPPATDAIATPAVPDQIAPWVPGDWRSLGTDGFGRSDTRAALRRHFRVDAQSIVVAALSELATRGEVKTSTVREALDRYALSDVHATTAAEAGGDS